MRTPSCEQTCQITGHSFFLNVAEHHQVPKQLENFSQVLADEAAGRQGS